MTPNSPLQKLKLLAATFRWIVLAIIFVALTSKVVALFSPKFAPVLNIPFPAWPVLTMRSALWIGILWDSFILLITCLARSGATRVLAWLMFSYLSLAVHIYVHLFAPLAMCSCIRLDAFGLNVSPAIPELVAFCAGCLSFIAIHLEVFFGFPFIAAGYRPFRELPGVVLKTPLMNISLE